MISARAGNGVPMRIRTGREIGRTLRRDWDNYKTGLLVAAAVTAGSVCWAMACAPAGNCWGFPAPDAV